MPIEVKRRRGTLRADRMPNKGNVAEVSPMSAPPSSSDEALALVLAHASPWLAESDALTVVLLRESLEERQQLRALVDHLATKDLRRALRDLDKQITTLLAMLGLDPSARARLGLAEVKAASKLQTLRNSRSDKS